MFAVSFAPQFATTITNTNIFFYYYLCLFLTAVWPWQFDEISIEIPFLCYWQLRDTMWLLQMFFMTVHTDRQTGKLDNSGPRHSAEIIFVLLHLDGQIDSEDNCFWE